MNCVLVHIIEQPGIIFANAPSSVKGSTADFIKKVPTATCALKDRWIVSIEQVYSPSTFYMKLAVCNEKKSLSIYYIFKIQHYS